MQHLRSIIIYFFPVLLCVRMVVVAAAAVDFSKNFSLKHPIFLWCLRSGDTWGFYDRMTSSQRWHVKLPPQSQRKKLSAGSTTASYSVQELSRTSKMGSSISLSNAFQNIPSWSLSFSVQASRDVHWTPPEDEAEGIGVISTTGAFSVCARAWCLPVWRLKISRDWNIQCKGWVSLRTVLDCAHLLK